MAVYLACLAPSSRHTMRAALDAIARLLITTTALPCPWTGPSCATATPPPCAPCSPTAATRRQRLTATWPRCAAFLKNAGDWRAADLEPVRGSRLPRGRALQPGELRSLFAACEEFESEKKPAIRGPQRDRAGAVDAVMTVRRDQTATGRAYLGRCWRAGRPAVRAARSLGATNAPQG